LQLSHEVYLNQLETSRMHLLRQSEGLEPFNVVSILPDKED